MTTYAQSALEAAWLCVLLTAANYLWASIMGSSFDKAFERSYFQWIAIFIYWFSKP